MSSHDLWYCRLILVGVAFLHTRHFVSFQACAMVLTCLNMVLVALGLVHSSRPLPRTLMTVFDRLEIIDQFEIRPTCSSCHALFPVNISPDSSCLTCDKPLFKAASANIYQRLSGRSPKPSPEVVTPYRSLSSLLEEFVARPGYERKCEVWRTRSPPPPGELHDISDGNIWNTVKGPDNKPFFDKPGSNITEPGELRLGVTLSLDW